jgi:hypothetical protein
MRHITLLVNAVPCTNTKPTRIKVQGPVKSKIYSWPTALDFSEACHKACFDFLNEAQWGLVTPSILICKTSFKNFTAFTYQL